MGYIEGQSREQVTIFPDTVDEYIAENNAVRVNQIVYDTQGREVEIISIKDNAINCVLKKERKVSSSNGTNLETQISYEDKQYNLYDFGTKLFFEKNDCSLSEENILKKAEYSPYEKNIENYNKAKNIKLINEIKKNAPDVLMTHEEELEIIESYYNKEFTTKQEEKFNKTCPYTYFARMDFNTLYYKEKHQDLFSNHYYDVIYIGKNGGGDYKVGNIALVDWRSPIASLFYDNQRTTYKIGDIYVYESELMLKRRLGFNPFFYQNNYISGNELFNEGTVDSFLIEAFRENRESHKSTDIIRSIQSNQNTIIRYPINKMIIIQGCAGSGKTMILLHRLSYLKFNHLLKDTVRTKIITPNNLFNLFISDLSHELELDSIDRLTMAQYYLSLANRYQNHYSTIGINLNEREKESNKKAIEMLDAIGSNELSLDIDFSKKTLTILYSTETWGFVNDFYNRDITKLFETIDYSGIKELLNKFGVSEQLYNLSKCQMLDKIFEMCSRSIDFENNKMMKRIEILEKDILTNSKLSFGIKEITSKNNLFLEMTKKYNYKADWICNKYTEYSAICANDYKNEILEFISGNADEPLNSQISLYLRNLIKKHETNLNIYIGILKKTLDIKQSDSSYYEWKIDKLSKQKSKIYKFMTNNDELINALNSIQLLFNECENILNDINNIAMSYSELSSKKLEEMETEKSLLKSKLLSDEDRLLMKSCVQKLSSRSQIVLNIYHSIKKHLEINYNISKAKLYKHDLVLMLYLYYAHFGKLKDGDKFLFIDEGQDYSEIEYDLLQKTNGQDVIFNIFGDTNQLLENSIGVNKWDNVKTLFEAELFLLNENYRNTYQITNFCNDVFEFNHLPIGISGDDAEQITFSELRRKLETEIDKNQDNRIAIISNLDMDLSSYSYDKRVNIGNVKSIKGLEYDVVFVIAEGMNKNEKYISFTRALSKLYVIW